jgi:RimJ/RimL family protein N-acetyltransferase
MQDEVRIWPFFVLNTWINDSQKLRELTASELLTLQEERDNQRSWREDHDKLTFIICLKDVNVPCDTERTTGSVPTEWMIGDINLFLKEVESESDMGDARDITGEINLMIAEPSARGKAYGIEALKTFLWYVMEHQSNILEEFARGKHCRAQNLLSLEAKIGKNNIQSIKLFERVGFKKVSETPNYFEEFDFALSLASSRKYIQGLLSDMAVSVQPYTHAKRR